MGKSILYAANTNSQNFVSTGTVINFGTLVRRYGCNCNLSGGNVEISGMGYYDLDANVTFVPSTTGIVTVEVLKDGVAIPGARAIVNGTATLREAITIPTVVRQHCNCTDTITVVISGTDGVVLNAAITAKRY